MEELKVGEYIRFYSGEIQKISKEDAKIMNKFYRQCPDMKHEHIYKRSSNIIDLIEVGDYVDRQLVDEKWYDCADKKKRFYFYNNGNLIGVEGYIKSIVTKEQFANVEYRLEE